MKMTYTEFVEWQREQSKNYRPPKKDLEHQLQCACVNWFRYAHQDLSLLLFAVPNGGRRDAATGMRLKDEGVVAGVSDLILLIPRGGYHGLCIEMKTQEGRQSDSQKKWEIEVKSQDYRYEIVRDKDAFMQLIEGYLCLPK